MGAIVRKRTNSLLAHSSRTSGTRGQLDPTRGPSIPVGNLEVGPDQTMSALGSKLPVLEDGLNGLSKQARDLVGSGGLGHT